MFGLEPGTVGFVGLEVAEVLDLAREPLAFQQVPRGVAVAARSRGAEREVDQRPPDQGGGERMLRLQRLRGRDEDVIEIAVQLPRPRHRQIGRAVERRPVDKEPERLVETRRGMDEVQRPLFRLDVLEVG